MTLSRRDALACAVGGTAAATIPTAGALAEGKLYKPASAMMKDQRAHENTFLIELPPLGPDQKEGDFVETPIGTKLFCNGREIGLVESISQELVLGPPDDVVRSKIEITLFGHRVEVRRRDRESS
jgi:hypothetical protein